MGGTSGLCIAKDCQQVFFLCSLTLFSSVAPSNLHPAIHTEVSILRSELNKKERVIIPYLILFRIRAMTARLDPISQFAMETTHWGRSINWREVADARDKDNNRKSRSAAERVRTLSRDDSENLRGHRGDVSASLLPRKNTGRAGERHALALTSRELDLWEKLLKRKLHREEDGAGEAEPF